MKTTARCLTLALLAAALGANAGDFRWGGSNKNNKVKYNNSYAYLSSDLVSPEGGQAFSLIAVSLSKPTKVTAGRPIEPGEYYSVAIKTGTSVVKTDGSGRAYASLVIDTVFANGDYSNPGAFVKAIEPVADGGYLWGSSVYNSYRVPNYSSGASTALNSTSARTYLYLGKAECRNGAVNLGKLVCLTNSTPQADGYAANYIAIQTGTSVSAVTSDGARHAQFVSDRATAVKDFLMTVPLVDVDGTTFGVYWGCLAV